MFFVNNVNVNNNVSDQENSPLMPNLKWIKITREIVLRGLFSYIVQAPLSSLPLLRYTVKNVESFLQLKPMQNVIFVPVFLYWQILSQFTDRNLDACLGMPDLKSYTVKKD